MAGCPTTRRGTERLEATLRKGGSQSFAVLESTRCGEGRSTSARTTFPFFGSMWGGNVHYGMGFTGGGVGPCVLGGQILSSLVLGRQDEFSSLPLVGLRSKRFPPEPLLYASERGLTLEAILRTDDAWEAGRSGSRLLETVARLPRRLGYNLGL